MDLCSIFDLICAGLGKDVPNLTPGSAGSQQVDQFEPDLSLENYPYEQLTVQSGNPAPDIDITRREVSIIFDNSWPNVNSFLTNFLNFFCAFST